MNHFKYLFLLSILCSLIFFSNCCRNCEYTQVNPDGSMSIMGGEGQKLCLLPDKDCGDIIIEDQFEMTDCSCGMIKDINVPFEVTNEFLSEYLDIPINSIPNFSDCISLSQDYFPEFPIPCILTDTLSHINYSQYSSIVMNNCSMNLIRICGWNDCHGYGGYICLDDDW